MANEMVKFDEVKVEIAEYQKKNKTLVFPYGSKQGSKDARSHITKLRKVKTKIIEVHKEAKSDILAAGRAIDAKKNEYTGMVDEMIDVHNKPLQEIKDREEAKIQEKIDRQEAEKKAEDDRKQEEFKAREAKQAEREAAFAEKEAEFKAKEAKVNADKEKVDRAKREKKIADEAAENAKKHAEAEAERVRLAEAEKVRREADEAAEKECKRVENKKHREAVENGIFDQLLMIISPLDNFTSSDIAVIIRDKIVDGRIDNVTVSY